MWSSRQRCRRVGSVEPRAHGAREGRRRISQPLWQARPCCHTSNPARNRSLPIPVLALLGQTQFKQGRQAGQVGAAPMRSPCSRPTSANPIQSQSAIYSSALHCKIESSDTAQSETAQTPCERTDSASCSCRQMGACPRSSVPSKRQRTQARRGAAARAPAPRS